MTEHSQPPPQTQRPNNLLIMGGTFDPIHIGHMRLLIDLQEAFRFDWVKIMPCGQPAHKAPSQSAAADRLAMTQLAAHALAENPGLFNHLEVDEREIHRTGVTRTVETLRILRKQLGPDLPITLILGLDSFINFEHWHAPDEIRSLANLLITGRPQYQAEIEQQFEHHAHHQTREKKALSQITTTSSGLVTFHPTRQIDLSSSEIRSDIRSAKELKWLLPDPVWHYIKTHKLYGWPHSELHHSELHSESTTDAVKPTR